MDKYVWIEHPFKEEFPFSSHNRDQIKDWLNKQWKTGYRLVSVVPHSSQWIFEKRDLDDGR